MARFTQKTSSAWNRVLAQVLGSWNYLPWVTVQRVLRETMAHAIPTIVAGQSPLKRATVKDAVKILALSLTERQYSYYLTVDDDYQLS